MTHHRFAATACLLAGVAAMAGEPGFLEDDVEVIYTVDGEGPGLEFGYVVETVGDITGDGVSEILTCAPYHGSGAASGGRLYLIDGAAGTVMRMHTGTTAGGFLGFRVANVGDLDGDTVPDYAASAAGNQGTSVTGAVFVYSGVDGTPIHTLDASAAGDRFGHGLDGPGDLDGDGTRDLLVGAPRNDTMGVDAGQAYVISGADGKIIRTHDGAGPGAWHGAATQVVGDLDDDGVTDYVVGASGDGPDGHGKAYVYSGCDGSLLFMLEPEATAREFGFYFADSPGDVTGDGINDIYVGDHFDVSTGGFTGRSYIFDGADGTPVCSIAGENGGDWTSWGGGGIGDVNGDGYADFTTNFITNAEVAAAPGAGRVRILSGRDCSVIRTVTSLYGTPDGAQGEWFGYDSRTVNDVNGDGTPDLLVTAGYNYANGARAGRLYMIAGLPVSCPEDIDGNGSIGFPDLLLVLANWGPCDGCPEDLDEDGVVAFSDLLMLLSVWGPCG